MAASCRALSETLKGCSVRYRYRTGLVDSLHYCPAYWKRMKEQFQKEWYTKFEGERTPACWRRDCPDLSHFSSNGTTAVYSVHTHLPPTVWERRNSVFTFSAATTSGSLL